MFFYFLSLLFLYLHNVGLYMEGVQRATKHLQSAEVNIDVTDRAGGPNGDTPLGQGENVKEWRNEEW